MKQYIVDRVYDSTKSLLEDELTVREIAKLIGVSKSTTHRDLTERLPYLNKNLHLRVQDKLYDNWKAGILKGGLAIRNKYKESSGNLIR